MATIAIRRLTLGEYYERALVAAPVLVGIALVPTLAGAAGREALPALPLLPLSHSALLEHFTCTALGVTQRRWWTYLTYALAHSDAQHKWQNLAGVALAGFQPAGELGRAGWLFTFFGGVVAAALNGPGRELQLTNWLDRHSGGLLSRLTPHAARLWSENTGWRLVGASAGVFALLGVDLCLTCEQAVAVARRWEDEPEEGRPECLYTLCWLGAAMAQTLSHVLAEQRSLASGASVSVSHVGHLTGFAWGVGVFVALRVLAPRLRSRRRRSGGAGGRRLGGR